MSSRENFGELTEVYECGLSVRGEYVPLGRKVPFGKKKLYVYIQVCDDVMCRNRHLQGTDKYQIKCCYDALRRQLDELTAELAMTEPTGPQKPAAGRYSVI